MLASKTITDPRAAAVFGNREQRQLVLALIERERSLTELAALSSLALNLLHYHLEKFVRLGLVLVSRVAPRGGRSIKFYRSAAKEFVVPAEWVTSLPGEALSRRLRESLEQARARDFAGMSYSHGPQGPTMRALTQSAGFRAAELWLELRLSEVDARQLSEDLRLLLKRYGQKPQRGRKRYLVHAALAEATSE